MLLVLAVAIGAGHEYFSMMQVGDYRPAYWIGMVWLCAMVLAAWQAHLVAVDTVITAGLIITLTYALFQHDHPLQTWVSTSSGIIYLGLVLGQGLALRLLPNGFAWLMLAVLITWFNDTAAYFVGYTLGKRKLWPRLSPKKTWEGTIGGFVGGTLAGGLIALFTPVSMGFAAGALLGLVCSVLALFGDLSISMIKRQIGVKDTGAIFPGHGGVLDRLDSVLFVIPVVYHVALWLQP